MEVYDKPVDKFDKKLALYYISTISSDNGKPGESQGRKAIGA